MVVSIAGRQVGLNIYPLIVMVDEVNIVVHKRFLRWDENRECQITLEDENIVGADESVFIIYRI